MAYPILPLTQPERHETPLWAKIAGGVIGLSILWWLFSDEEIPRQGNPEGKINIINQDQIKDWIYLRLPIVGVNTFEGVARSNAITRWFKTVFFKRLIQEVLQEQHWLIDTKGMSRGAMAHAFFVDYSLLDKSGVPSWVVAAQERGDSLRYLNRQGFDFLSDRLGYNELGDWMFQLPAREWKKLPKITYDQAMRKQREWHEEVVRRAEKRLISKKDTAPVVYSFPDGWSWKQLTNKDELDYESVLMRHCISSESYAPQITSGTYLAYSLRDPENKPHATLGIAGMKSVPALRRGSEKQIYKAVFAKTLDEVEYYRFDQFQGVANSEPKAEYGKRVEKLIPVIERKVKLSENALEALQEIVNG